MYNIKTEKQTIQLILCQLDLGGWWKEKGTRLKLCVCFSVFVLCIAWKRGLPQKCAHFALFRPMIKRNFNLLCVFVLCVIPSVLCVENYKQSFTVSCPSFHRSHVWRTVSKSSQESVYHSISHLCGGLQACLHCKYLSLRQSSVWRTTSMPPL